MTDARLVGTVPPIRGHARNGIRYPFAPVFWSSSETCDFSFLEEVSVGADDHPLHQVKAGDQLCHRMLDLKAGVDFEEVERLAFEQELDRAGTDVADVVRQRQRPVVQPLTDIVGDARGGRFLDELLVASLDRALAITEMDHVAVTVGDHLDLHMTRPGQVLLHVHAAVAEGRQAYLALHLVPDTLFPIGYALVFTFISAWFLVRLLPLDHRLQWLSLIPLISGLADVIENLSLVICNLVYPGRIDWLVQFAHLMTKVKFGLLPIGLVFLIIIMVVWFIRKRPASNVPKGN